MTMDSMKPVWSLVFLRFFRLGTKQRLRSCNLNLYWMYVECGTIEYGCSLGRRKTRHQGVAQPPLLHHLTTSLYSTPPTHHSTLLHSKPLPSTIYKFAFLQTSHKQLIHTTTTSSLQSGSCSEILLLQLTNIWFTTSFTPHFNTPLYPALSLLPNLKILPVFFGSQHWLYFCTQVTSKYTGCPEKNTPIKQTKMAKHVRLVNIPK